MPSTGVSILGSTGSIGCNSLRVIASLSGDMHIVGLAAGNNVSGLAVQIATHLPQMPQVHQKVCVHRLQRQGARIGLVGFGETPILL